MANIVQAEQINSGFSGSALTLMGNAMATSGPAVIIDNGSLLTSGKLLSFRSNGVELSYIDYQGNFSGDTGGGPPTGAAGGDLAGLYPNPTINTVHLGTLNLGPAGSSSLLTPSLVFNVGTGGGLATASITGNETISTYANLNYSANIHTWSNGQNFNIMSWNNNGILDLGPSGDLHNLTPTLRFNSSTGGNTLHTSTIQGTGTGLNYSVTTGDAHNFQINSTTEATLTTASLSLLPSELIVGSAQNSGTIVMGGTSGSYFQYNPALAFPGFNFASHVVASGSVAFTDKLIPNGSSPTVGSFHANFGTVTGSGITGSDPAGIITFTTGTASSIGANSALCVVTLSLTYASSQYAIMVSYAQSTGALDVTAFYAVPTSAGSFTIYNVSAITPGSSTTYQLQFMTMGAGTAY